MNSKRDHLGFTLIELLVTIGIIALLIGIALPALSGARKRARDVVGLSNMRQTGVAMENYVSRYGGWMPFAEEGAPFFIGSGVITTHYWDLSSYWSSLFLEVAPWEEWFGLWTFPDPRRSDEYPWAGSEGNGGPFFAGQTSFQYSRALFARPEIWEPGEMIRDRDLVLRGVRRSEIRYPSGKVSLFDGELCVRVHCDDPQAVKRTMLFVDGHAGMYAFQDAIDPAQGRLDELSMVRDPIHDTAGGAHGRDY